jgi:hypothetical protein
VPSALFFAFSYVNSFDMTIGPIANSRN